jgi:hypothetical protein
MRLRGTVIVAWTICPSIVWPQARHAGIEQMPPELEVRFALSAVTPEMRAAATVYRLDVQHGYVIAQRGTSGVACLVQRTAWEQADFRDDIYVPRCYDAAGSRSYLRVLVDAAELRAQGMKPDALKAEIERRYRAKQYTTPDRAGLSYMLAPVMRTWLPDQTVRTLTGPHVMFYAPDVSAKDIGTPAGAAQNLPFVVEEGVPEQSFIIQLVGDSERAAILAESKRLLDDLCAYRDVLCMPPRRTR